MFQRISNLKKTNSIILSAPYNDGKYKFIAIQWKKSKYSFKDMPPQCTSPEEYRYLI